MRDRHRLIISCCLLIGAALFLGRRTNGEVRPLHRQLDSFPIVVDEWRGEEGVLFEEKIHDRLQFSDYLMRRYVDSFGRSLWLYIGYWESQRRGAVPHSPKHCLPGNGWDTVEAQRVMVPLVSGATPIEVNRYVVQKDQKQQLVLYWFLSQGQPVASETFSRLLLVKNALLYNRTDGALIRITSPLYGTVEETFAYQVTYMQAMYPLLQQFLPD
jgi:EpsI family protein